MTTTGKQVWGHTADSPFHMFSEGFVVRRTYFPCKKCSTTLLFSLKMSTWWRVKCLDRRLPCIKKIKTRKREAGSWTLTKCDLVTFGSQEPPEKADTFPPRTRHGNLISGLLVHMQTVGHICLTALKMCIFLLSMFETPHILRPLQLMLNMKHGMRGLKSAVGPGQSREQKSSLNTSPVQISVEACSLAMLEWLLSGPAPAALLEATVLRWHKVRNARQVFWDLKGSLVNR